MLAENPVLTTKRFIDSWQSSNVDPNRLSVELMSVFDETNRRLNNFYFIVKNGELLDPATNNIIDFPRNTTLEMVEGKVWNSLKNWANDSSEGVSIWTSPQLEGVYPCDKVIHYQIAYTFEYPPQKVLLSTAILLDNQKSYFSEELRDQLIIKDANFTLTSLLEELGQVKNESEPTASQKTINYFVAQIKSGRDASSIAEEMQVMGVIGEHSISCPTASSGVLLNHSKILDFSKKENWEWHKGDCVIPAPECGRKNVDVGPCGVCRACQDKFDKTDLVA